MTGKHSWYWNLNQWSLWRCEEQVFSADLLVVSLMSFRQSILGSLHICWKNRWALHCRLKGLNKFCSSFVDTKRQLNGRILGGILVVFSKVINSCSSEFRWEILLTKIDHKSRSELMTFGLESSKRIGAHLLRAFVWMSGENLGNSVMTCGARFFLR